jgi:hypothetical protein
MAGVKERFCNGLCHRVLHYRRYDRALLCDRCYQMLPIWKVTMVAKYDMQRPVISTLTKNTMTDYCRSVLSCPPCSISHSFASLFHIVINSSQRATVTS